MLDYLELASPAPPRRLMVWLHGLGADGYDLQPVAEMLDLEGIRHVFPNAPVRPVTINGGMAMRAWYDIAMPDLQWQEDSAGMQASAHQVRELVGQLCREADLPVVLAGFSQGAVISLVAAAGGIHGLVGVIAMSGYVPRFLAQSAGAFRGMRLAMMHGEQDEVVPFALGKAGRAMLDEAGARVVWHAYPMPHAICQQEIQDMAEWLGGLPEFTGAPGTELG